MPALQPAGNWTSVSVAGLVALLFLLSPVSAAPGWMSPHATLIGYHSGDDWEPSVASDLDGEVYVVWAHFGGVHGCSNCGSPAAMIQISRDWGRSFGAPSPLFPTSAQQVDLNVAVNASGVVFVTYLQGLATVLQRSTDEGATFSSPLSMNRGLVGSTDKPGLVVHGSSVYVAFDIRGHPVLSASSDGGSSFHRVVLDPSIRHLGFSLTSGGAVAADGTVYYSWNGVHGNASLTPQTNYLTRSSDGGKTWTLLPVSRGLPAGPACPQSCGWDFLGPQMVVAVESSGAVDVLFNAGRANGSAPSVWFERSTDRGQTFTSPRVLSTDGSSAWHEFPALGTGARGEVFAAWMDNHTGAYNVWFRSSLNGGRTWGPEIRLPAPPGRYGYLNSSGFAFPYGDYFTLDINPRDWANVAWGLGPNWTGPGNVAFARVPIQD